MYTVSVDKVLYRGAILGLINHGLMGTDGNPMWSCARCLGYKQRKISRRDDESGDNGSRLGRNVRALGWKIGVKNGCWAERGDIRVLLCAIGNNDGWGWPTHTAREHGRALTRYQGDVLH